MKQLPQPLLINAQGNGFNIWQKSIPKTMKEGMEILNAIQDVYLDRKVTIA